ncbi:MAG: molybdopterin-dependent oxidoreductase [Rhodospirillaceae bacterium]|jgi:formate dehydrogenase|nr:molybdopterin-dependent oxidoreductase [Rhodospirillaceae bacterium]MBT3490789.1 molybdopterin-dependent oxidoreductase [Rhodospirillaceae bacterium]MBT3976393.1 molybdopterin-dependent oxidoreductase [Rhodospirillaceae bacterium]MBT4563956.1 molybdopterin-dependent oxidoreductase [Rhodospirillaceae bacterium]MBT5129037.1 molybdopterin-dependent oxidoreductase [Rhodospirillaceae bacterium]
MADKAAADWKKTACVLCGSNCGVLVQLGGRDGREIVRVRGDKAHPGTKGYTCNKALQLNYYQSAKGRLTSPLRRRDDGSFEEIDWATAISEIAEKFIAIRDELGGDKIVYYGGGGQGNHLGGGYSPPLRRALGSRYRGNALAQEKTGLSWVFDRMVGGFYHGDFEHCETALLVGKNPWHSNGFPRARVVLRQLAKDPNRKLIVIDPRVTETAELADIHLRVQPGRDAWLLAAILGQLVQADLIDHAWLAAHAQGHEEVIDALSTIPVAQYAAFAGIEMPQIEEVADILGRTNSLSVLEDLGIEMAPNSTVNSYHCILLFLLTGNFAKAGAVNLPAQLVTIFTPDRISESRDERGHETGYKTTPVTQSRIISGLIPCNLLPDEIITDHPDRFRAMLIESANPVHSLADAKRMREALATLDLVVVIDVAMTETAKAADYVLPASSQYEKPEMTFFNFEFPENCAQLRAPLMPPLPGTLSEPEIHARLLEAIDPFNASELEPLRAAAQDGLEAYAMAYGAAAKANPKINHYGAYILYRTLGPSLATGMSEGAALLGVAQMFAATETASLARAGFEGTPMQAGNKLFEALLAAQSGLVFSIDAPEDSFRRNRLAGGTVNLHLPEMLDKVRELDDYAAAETTAEFPLVLAAGERRSYTANTVVRDPAWAKSNNALTLAVNPTDAASLGINDGGTARLTTVRDSVEVVVELDKRMLPGTISLPNGFGLSYPDAQGNEVVTGISPNELTAVEDRDDFAYTPWHKFVLARLETP